MTNLIRLLTEVNRGNYIEFLQVLKHFHPLLIGHLETDIDSKGISTAIQNDLIKAVLT
jgi:hypothetical protein